jgi:hypothetical protein
MVGFQVVVAVLAAAGLSDAAELKVSYRKYCIRYFGSVRADVDLATTVPQFNYNGSIPCPRKWAMPRVRGATLTFCPFPDYVKNPSGSMMEIEFSLRGMTSIERHLPVDDLSLRDILLTNGSMPGPFPNGATPAVLTYDTEKSTQFFPSWILNGTQASLYEDPTTRGNPKSGVFFSCQDLTKNDYPKERYCGWYQDYDAGCWISQTIPFSMQGAVNYSITFNNNEATVKLWTTSEWYQNDSYTGANTTAYVEFGGTRSLPSVTDYDYWRNSETVYEVEKENVNSMKWETDDNKLPVFINNTATKETYAARNQTFSTNSSPPTIIPLSLYLIIALAASWVL